MNDKHYCEKCRKEKRKKCKNCGLDCLDNLDERFRIIYDKNGNYILCDSCFQKEFEHLL